MVGVAAKPKRRITKGLKTTHLPMVERAALLIVNAKMNGHDVHKWEDWLSGRRGDPENDHMDRQLDRLERWLNRKG